MTLQQYKHDHQVVSFTLRNGVGANILIQVYVYVQGENNSPGNILEMQNDIILAYDIPESKWE